MRSLWLVAMVGCTVGDGVSPDGPMGDEVWARSGVGDTSDSGLILMPTNDDQCPSDPNKTEPGFCGCDWVDLDVDGSGGPETCVSSLASVDSNAVIGLQATIAPYATVGEATIGAGAFVAHRATVSDGAVIGDRTIVSRRAEVGQDANIGPDSVLGRSSVVGANVDASVGSLEVGYASQIGDGTLITGEDVVIGSLVDVGTDVTLHEGVVLARGVVVESGAEIGASTVIGPDVRVGTQAVIGEMVRIRKQVTIGANSTIGDSSRIGRASVIEDNVTLPADAVLGAHVFIGENNVLMGEVYLPRRARIEPIPGGIDAPPEVVIASPARGTDVSGGSVLLSGTATDDRGVASLTVRFNDGPALNLPLINGAFSETVSVPDNTQTIRVTATDTIGQTANDLVVVDDCTPGSLPPAQWTGSVSADWSNPGNWSNGLAPGASSDVFICGSVVPQPVLLNHGAIGDLFMSGTATLDTNGRTLNANGDVVAGVIDGGGIVLMPNDTSLRGVVPGLDIRGDVTLSGYTMATGAVSILGGSSLDVNSRTFHAGSTYNQDINASDAGIRVATGGVILFDGEASFNGSREMAAANLADGTLRFRGDLTVQDIATRVFRPSDTMPVYFESPTGQTITMRSSHSAGTRLGNVIVAGPGPVSVDISTDLFIEGTTTIQDGATFNIPSGDLNGDITIVGTGQLTGSLVDMYSDLTMDDASTVTLNLLNTHTRLPRPAGTFAVTHVDVVDDVSLDADWDHTMPSLRVPAGGTLRSSGFDLTLTGDYSQEIGDGSEGLRLSTDDVVTINGNAYFGGTRFMSASNLANGILRFRGDLLVQDIAITLFLPSATRPVYFDGPGDQTITMRTTSDSLSRLENVVIGGGGTVFVDSSSDLYIGGTTTIEDGAHLDMPSGDFGGDVVLQGTGELTGSVVDTFGGLTMDPASTVSLTTIRAHSRLPQTQGSFTVSSVDVVGDVRLQSDWNGSISLLRVLSGAQLRTDGNDLTLTGDYSQVIGSSGEGLRLTAGDTATFNGNTSFTATQFIGSTNWSGGTLRFQGDVSVQSSAITAFDAENSTVVFDGPGDQSLSLGSGRAGVVGLGPVSVAGFGTKTFTTAGATDVDMQGLTISSSAVMQRDTLVDGDLLVEASATLGFGSNAFNVTGACTVLGTAPANTCN